MASSGEVRRILIVEDDPAVALGLADALGFEGFEVVHAATGEDALLRLDEGNADCILLDVMLPDMNGYQVCEAVRRRNLDVPILMLTARAQEVDKIRGLDAGADDYVTKPFALGELVARIRALLRRRDRATRPPTSAPFRVGEWLIDPQAQTLTRGRSEEPLSYQEVELLKYLYAHAGEPVSREELLENVWGVAPTQSSRTVDNFIVKLRKKLEERPDKPRHILTAYGVGYKLVI